MTEAQVVIHGFEYVAKDWRGLMQILDDIYPADVFTGTSGDPGPQIVALARRIDELENTLGVVLAQYTEKGYPGRACYRTGWITTEQVDRWRATLTGGSTPNTTEATATSAEQGTSK